jgi:hypothetical protein
LRQAALESVSLPMLERFDDPGIPRLTRLQHKITQK